MQNPSLNQINAVTEDWDDQVTSLKKKAVRGVLFLGFRRIAIQVIQSAASIILARILFPEDFGAFSIIFVVISFFSLVSDIGLHGAFVQSTKKPAYKELQSIFTVQVLMGLFAVFLIWFIAPFYLDIFHYSINNGLYLIRLSSFALVFFNLRLISGSLLEREMAFSKQTILEIIEIIILQVVTIILAIRGMGVASFIWGILISRLLIAIAYFFIKPWKIGIRINFKEIKPYFSFAFHYHVNSIIGTVNGSLVSVVAGGIFGPAKLGLISWAGGVGSLPRASGDIIARIAFPLGSRLQNDKKTLTKTIEKSIQYANFITFPVVALMIGLAQPITYIIFTSKWSGGIHSLYFFILQSIFISFTSILSSVLLGLGMAKVVRNINLISSAIIWILIFPLMHFFDYNSFAIATFFSSLTFLISLRELKKKVPIKILKYTYSYLLASVFAGLIVFSINIFYPLHSIFDLISVSIFGGLIYLFFLFLLEGSKIWKELLNYYYLYLGFTKFNFKFIEKIFK